MIHVFLSTLFFRKLLLLFKLLSILFSSWLKPLSVVLHSTSPRRPSPRLFVPITTKPCHRCGCGHVNHPASIICSQLFTSSQTKESAFLLSPGWSAVSGWGLLFNSARCFPSPSLKRPIQHRESMKWERRQGGKDVNMEFFFFFWTQGN